MVRKIIFTCFFLLLLQMTFAQQAYTKGSSTISAGYGFINVWETLFQQFIQETSSIGPFTLQYEYGISNKISGGILMGYSIAKGTFEADPNIYVLKIKNFSALLVANYHFGHFKKWDPYAGANFGYYHFDYSQKTTNPSIIIPPEVVYKRIPSSVGFAGQAGVKYYFNPKFAAFFEAGYISAAVIHVGGSVKF